MSPAWAVLPARSRALRHQQDARTGSRADRASLDGHAGATQDMAIGSDERVTNRDGAAQQDRLAGRVAREAPVEHGGHVGASEPRSIHGVTAGAKDGGSGMENDWWPSL